MGILGEVDIDRTQTKKKFDAEIARYQTLVENVLGKDSGLKNIPRLDHKGCVRHILTTGTREEKRELLSSVKSNMIVTNRVVSTTAVPRTGKANQ